MKKFIRGICWFIGIVMILLLVVGNVFYRLWQPLVQSQLSSVLPLQEDMTLPSVSRYEIEARVNKQKFQRYEPFSFALTVRERRTRDIVSNAMVRFRVINQAGTTISDIRGQDEIWIRYNADTQDWHGTWYPHLQFRETTLHLLFTVQFQDPVPPITVTQSVTILPNRKNQSLGSGLSMFFIEEMESISRRSLLSINNEERDWNLLPEWFNLLNVDGVLVMGGVTRFLEQYSAQDPWNAQKLQEALTVARWAAAQGRGAGVWIRAFRGDGNLSGSTVYETTWHKRNNQWRQDVSLISLTSEARYRALHSIVNLLEQQDAVSYIGISDFFPSTLSGLELGVPFLESFVGRLPAGWADWSWEQKFAHARNFLENQHNYSVFLQWKRYHLVDRLRKMLEAVRKPVFYVLSWEELANQPDILDVLSSAGCDFFVIQLNMSYQDFVNRERNLLNHPLIRPYLSSIVWVNQIQYQHFHLSAEFANSIDGFIAFNESLVKNNIDPRPSLGLGVNFYKAMYGNRGPYNPIEWLVGAGESFGRVRQIRERTPLEVDFLVPRFADTNTIHVRLRMKNRSLEPLRNIVVEHIPTRMVRINGSPRLTWRDISPNNTTEALMSFSLDDATDKFARRDRLVALRISWTTGRGSDSLILMRSLVYQEPERQAPQQP